VELRCIQAAGTNFIRHSDDDLITYCLEEGASLDAAYDLRAICLKCRNTECLSVSALPSIK